MLFQLSIHFSRISRLISYHFLLLPRCAATSRRRKNSRSCPTVTVACMDICQIARRRSWRPCPQRFFFFFFFFWLPLHPFVMYIKYVMFSKQYIAHMHGVSLYMYSVLVCAVVKIYFLYHLTSCNPASHHGQWKELLGDWHWVLHGR